LRKGKCTESRSEAEKLRKAEARTQYDREMRNIIASWPQIVPQSLKDKVINIFRQQTSSESLATSTCASCAESALRRSNFSLSLDNFDKHLLLRPDLKSNELLLLDRYKWLHPDCVPPLMPYDEGPLRDLLVDPDVYLYPQTAGSPLFPCVLPAILLSEKQQNAAPIFGKQKLPQSGTGRAQKPHHY
jgi:hypothetical protein